MASPTPSASPAPEAIGATFATLACASPSDLRLPHALDVLLQPSTHLSTLLQYIDLPTLASLRSLPLFRERIARLVSQKHRANNHDGSSSGGSASIPQSTVLDQLLRSASGSEPDMFLRNCLTESKYLDANEEVEEAGADEVSAVDPPAASRLPRLVPKPKREVWALSKLGLLALASSPLATEIALQNLIQLNVPGHDIDDKTKGLVYERIAENEAASAATLSLLLDHVKQLEINGFVPSSCNRSFHRIALNKNASSEVLAKLLEAASTTHLCVAKHPNTSQDVLSSIINACYSHPENGSPVIRRTVPVKYAATHPNTPLSFLESFADDANPDIRFAVASNPSLPPHLLSRLSMDEEMTIRMKVASNKSTPKEDLFRLCRDDHYLIRVAIAHNVSADNGALALLSMDADATVRASLAGNPNIDPDDIFDVKDKLNYRALAYYSRDAGKLKFLSTVEDASVEVKAGVARNSCAAKDTLARLAHSEEREVRAAVATNENTPPSILLLLSNDPDAYVRASVASNQSTSSEILNRFASVHGDQQGVYHSIKNPATDPETVGAYFTSLMSAIESNQRGISQVHILSMLSAICHRDDVPLSVLSLMSKCKFSEVRIAMAKNRRLPTSELSRLSKDPAQDVANAVADNAPVQGAADAISCLLSSHGFSA